MAQANLMMQLFYVEIVLAFVFFNLWINKHVKRLNYDNVCNMYGLFTFVTSLKCIGWLSCLVAFGRQYWGGRRSWLEGYQLFCCCYCGCCPHSIRIVVVVSFHVWLMSRVKSISKGMRWPCLLTIIFSVKGTYHSWTNIKGKVDRNLGSYLRGVSWSQS